MFVHRKNLAAWAMVAGVALATLLGAFARLGLSPPAQVALAMLLIAAILWMTEAVPLFVTGLLVLGLSLVWLAPVMRSHGMPVDETTFLAPFFSDIILLFLGGFVLAAGLQRCRLDEQLARWMIGRASGSVPRLIAGILVVTAFLSMWLSNTATAAMMLALCLPIARSLNADDRYRKALVLAVPLAANVGGLGTPIGSPPNAIAMQYLVQSSVPLSFGTWMLVGVPGVLMMLTVTWFTLLLLFRGQAATIRHTPNFAPFQFTRETRGVVAIAVLTALGWMTGAWHGYSPGTVALLPILAFFGTRLLDITDLRSLSWDVLLMMGGGLCLGAAITASGLAGWMIQHLPTDGPSLLWLIVVFGSLATLMSSVMSNTATANLMMPIIVGLGAELRAPMLVAVAFCCTLAMPLPISTPPNAITFGSGELTATDMLRAGLTVTLLGLALAFTTGYAWWDLMGLF